MLAPRTVHPVLHGIDDIDWSALDGAYGPCAEAPDILRGLASPDPEEAGEAMYEFGSSLWHQGTVYPATVEAIPYLIELASTDGVHRRADLLHILGDLCDPTLTDGRDQPLVRAAVAVHSGPLLPLLTDADPRIREHAAYAAAHSGPHTLDTLRERWATEDHPAVRASVLAALAHLEPAATVPLLAAALHDPSPELRATAATALVRSGGSLPPETLEPVGAALAAAGAEDTPWAGHRSAWDVVFDATEPAAAAILGAPLARSADPEVRSRLLHSVNARLLRSRSSVAALFPLAAPLLADPDPEVRSDAAVAALAAGPAVATLLTTAPAAPAAPATASGTASPTSPGVAGSVSPGVAGSVSPGVAGSVSPGVAGSVSPGVAGSALPGVAGSALPGVAGSDSPGASAVDGLLDTARAGSRCALLVLMRLGHPGYPEALAAAWDAGKVHDVLSGTEPPFDPDALTVIRKAITGPRPGAPASPYFVASSFSDIAGLLAVLESWGPAAAPAVPEIAALLKSHPSPAASALAAIGPAALPAVPALTASALTGDVPAGHAILRLTGDPAPLIAAATAVLPTPDPVDHQRLLADRVGTQLTQRRLRRPGLAGLRLRQ
ncbi:HEAT repeat domain-containing protein, partial [Actinoplanes philippinensis]